MQSFSVWLDALNTQLASRSIGQPATAYDMDALQDAYQSGKSPVLVAMDIQSGRIQLGRGPNTTTGIRRVGAGTRRPDRKMIGILFMVLTVLAWTVWVLTAAGIVVLLVLFLIGAGRSYDLPGFVQESVVSGWVVVAGAIQGFLLGLAVFFVREVLALLVSVDDTLQEIRHKP